jgi:hypothetical protein
MESAFGIEHGEVSKARKKNQRVIPPNYEPAGTKLKRIGNKVGGAQVSLKEIGNSAGAGAMKVGRGFQRFPGMTGAALVGGTGYGGYKLATKDKKQRP